MSSWFGQQQQQGPDPLFLAKTEIEMYNDLFVKMSSTCFVKVRLSFLFISDSHSSNVPLTVPFKLQRTRPKHWRTILHRSLRFQVHGSPRKSWWSHEKSQRTGRTAAKGYAGYATLVGFNSFRLWIFLLSKNERLSYLFPLLGHYLLNLQRRQHLLTTMTAIPVILR